MSINTTDKIADTVETLINNTNQAITTINNQLDSSVLNNLKTKSKNTLVNSINEVVNNKLDKDGGIINNILEVKNEIISKSIKIKPDEHGNSVVYFYDTTNSIYIKLFWNNSLQKYQLSFPNGSIVDIANSLDINDLQTQINNVSNLINYNFNTNGKSLILKQMTTDKINNYIGPAGEIVINSDEWSEIRVQDGVTVGGIIISGSLITDWKTNTIIKKNQCVYYGNGLYRSKDKHITTNTFDINHYDILAAYKKHIENQITKQITDTIILKHPVNTVYDFELNINDSIIQKPDITVIDRYHIKLNKVIEAKSKIEITYFEAANLINSSVVINTFTSINDNTTIIPLLEEVKSYILVIDVNVNNVSLMNSEWSLGEGNKSIILKTPIKSNTKVQVKFWKGVHIAQNGITFTPVVKGSELSWINDGGLPNPEPLNIVTINNEQTIEGNKIFNSINVPTVSVTNKTNTAASTKFVDDYSSNKHQIVNALPSNPDPNTFYYIPKN